MSKITHYIHFPGTPLPVNPQESVVRSMSNEEVKRRAKNDPDAPLVDPKTFHKFKRVNP